MSTPAGWYPDPQDGSQERWWNGSSWSDAWQPRAGAPPPPLAPAAAPYGVPQVPYGASMAAPPTHGSATLALVLGILSLVMCGLLTGIPAMVLGRRAAREIDRSGGAVGGRGIATAGFWTGLAGTALSALSVLFVVLLLVVGATSSSTSTGEDDCTIYSDGTSSGC